MKLPLRHSRAPKIIEAGRQGAPVAGRADAGTLL